MQSHTHASAFSALLLTLFIVTVFGSLHLWALSSDTRFARAWLALGF